jgi:hypothetical protein
MSASIKSLTKVQPMFFAKVLSDGIFKFEGKGNPGQKRPLRPLCF